MSEQDLRQYNGDDEEELQVGYTINIPNMYQSINIDTNEVAYNYAIARGIDISSHQNFIDWNTVAQTSDFVITRLVSDYKNYAESEGIYYSECISHIKNILKQELELGLYFCIPEGMKVSVYEERLRKYFEKFESDLQKNGINLERENIPVFLDFEVYYQYNDYYKLMEVFKKVCKEHGFSKIGIYANGSTLDSISKNLEKDGEHIEIKDTDWYVWKSGGKQYSTHEDTDVGIDVEEVEEPKNESNTCYTPSILQATNVGRNTGAANDKGNCDIDFCYLGDLFGTDFNNDEEKKQNDLIQYVSIDLSQYKNMDVYSLVNVIANGALAWGCFVAAIDLIGRKLVIKLKRVTSDKVDVIQRKRKK